MISNQAASRDQLNRFRNSDNNNNGAMKWSGGNGVQQSDGEQLRRWFRGDSGNAGQLGDGNKSPGTGQFGNRRNGPGNGVGNGPGNAPGNTPGNGGQFGKWSKRDGGNVDPKTASWFGKSGFGDHRGRGDGKGDWNQGNFAGDGKWNGGNWNGGKGGNRNGGKDWDRNKWGDHVRDDWNKNWWNKHGNHDWDWYRGRGWRDVPFAYGWWGGRRNFGYCYYWNGWRNDPWYWWGGCSAPLLTTWIDFGWNYPCYWDYGPGQYVTYYNNTVYVDGQRYATELDYYAQVRNLARSVPTLTQQQLANIEWLPLGVFAVTRSGQAQANELIQLAVSKDGILSGTLLDQQTGRARPLQGMVDQATQKAAWMFADSPTDALVLETSLYNLTEPQCTALAHLDAVNTEVWQLVRLNQPQQPAGGAAPAAAPGRPGERPPARRCATGAAAARSGAIAVGSRS